MNPTGFPPVAETLPKAVERIVSELQPEKIILFGSYAYGTPTHDSDVDLLIIMETNGRRKEKHRAASMLLYPRQFPVDIIIKTPKEVEEAMKGGKDNSFFIREIIKKGKVLYDRHRRT
ncbi:MAG: nucleotidyltransferase domain-containing protein [Chloroflexi bacterium]|nr:nucleotidyltransferase domain-containing protein [Chloroflexota bacterium]MDL1942521.1 nucleotidyltransferase domain-containing protein [Chloroflexi bacterium CFX2]